MPVECHGDNTSLTFQDTHLFSLLILLVHVNKFNVYEGSPNADSTRRVLSIKDSITRNYTSQCKGYYFGLYDLFVSLTFILGLREDLESK